MKVKKNKNKADEFKLPTYEGYTVVTRSVKPPKKIKRRLMIKNTEIFGIDFSEELNKENGTKGKGE